MGDAVHEPVAESICVNAGGDGGIRFVLKVALKINDRTQAPASMRLRKRHTF